MNRRNFLASMAGGAACAALGSCAAPARGVAEDGAEPPLAIVDAHAHFYDPARPQGVPWPDQRDAVLYKTTLPAHYRAQPVPRKVAGVVVVEASPWVEDNRWILDLAAEEPLIVGVVGNLPVGTNVFADLLERFAANPLFRGVRIRDPKPPRGIEDKAALADLALLAERRLALDLVGGSEILAQAKFLAERLPELAIVIDHLAGVRIDGKAPPEDWLAALGALVRHPRVIAIGGQSIGNAVAALLTLHERLDHRLRLRLLPNPLVAEYRHGAVIAQATRQGKRRARCCPRRWRGRAALHCHGRAMALARVSSGFTKGLI